MATKLRKLVINEISLVDKGANPGAHIVMYKRDVDPEEDETTESPLSKRKRRSFEDDEIGRHGSAPKDYYQNFKAGGVGPATDRLWVSYDNYRRGMPARAQAAFALAWNGLTDDEKDEIRAEEASTEAAMKARADAKQTERRNQMSDEGLMFTAAHAIASGELENTVRKSTWHSALRKMASVRQEAGETIERAVTRLVKTDPDALALFKASLTGAVDDVPPAPAAPTAVLKHGTAYASLRAIAAEMCKADASLTRHSAIAKIASDPKHRELWEKAKRDA